MTEAVGVGVCVTLRDSVLVLDGVGELLGVLLGVRVLDGVPVPVRLLEPVELGVRVGVCDMEAVMDGVREAVAEMLAVVLGVCDGVGVPLQREEAWVGARVSIEARRVAEHSLSLSRACAP